MVAQSNAMNKLTTFTAIPTRALKLEALSNISASFKLFCLACGVKALGEMMDHAAQAICGPRHARGRYRQGHRWGKTKAKIGFHGGKVEIDRPRLRGFDAGRDVDQHLVHCSLAEPVLRNCRLPTRYRLLLPTLDDLRELERGVLDKTSRADRLLNADEVSVRASLKNLIQTTSSDPSVRWKRRSLQNGGPARNFRLHQASETRGCSLLLGRNRSAQLSEPLSD
jgi:hypothetical protein